MKTLGGLVMTRDESGDVVTLTLTCATHYRDWRVIAQISKLAIQAAEQRIVKPKLGIDRSDRGAILLADTSAGLMREARHSLRSCACASPLFDDVHHARDIYASMPRS